MSVAVTGIVAVSALGPDTGAFLRGLREGVNACAMHDFERIDGSTIRAPAYLAETPDAKQWIEPRKLRRMDRLVRMSAVAARLALKQAGLETLDSIGVIFGTAFGALATTQKFVDSWIKQGERHASPLQFTHSVHGIIASQIALDLGARGPNLTLSQRDISFEAALVTACQWIESGHAEALLVGGADELTPLLHEFASRLYQVELGEVSGLDPWGRTLNIPGDGAGVLLLEREGGPRRALAHIQAARLGRTDVEGGDAVAALLQRVDCSRVDLVTTGRDGNRRGEACMVKREAALDDLLSGDVAKLSHRGSFGSFATAGALQCAANVLMLSEGERFTPLANGEARAEFEGPAPTAILHDAASTSGNHAAYLMTAV